MVIPDLGLPVDGISAASRRLTVDWPPAMTATKKVIMMAQKEAMAMTLRRWCFLLQFMHLTPEPAGFYFQDRLFWTVERFAKINLTDSR